jgi:hypothetical protein
MEKYKRTFGRVVLGVFAVLALGQLMVPMSVAQDGGDIADISNWNQVGDANWRMEDGMLVADEGNGHVVTPGTFGDFEINLEFWADKESNSGVYIRCTDPDAIAVATCYEVNIYDTREDQTYASGAIVNLAPPSQKMETEERWNTYKIRAEGGSIVVVLNGVETVNVQDDRLTEGHIALQFGTGRLKFRNVRIESL